MTPGQRRDVVLMLLRGEESAQALSRRYGISDVTLYRWRDEFLAGGEAALANGRGKADGHARQIPELEKALAERDRVIGELTIANRILKKRRGDCCECGVAQGGEGRSEGAAWDASDEGAQGAGSGSIAVVRRAGAGGGASQARSEGEGGSA